MKKTYLFSILIFLLSVSPDFAFQDPAKKEATAAVKKEPKKETAAAEKKAAPVESKTEATTKSVKPPAMNTASKPAPVKFAEGVK